MLRSNDSDGSEDFLVKEITTGVGDGGASVSCWTDTDYCWSERTLIEYFITPDGYVDFESYYCDLRNDGNVRCIDGKCGCLYDSDCPAKDNIKGKCDSPSGTPDDEPGYTYTCYWPKCQTTKNDCVDNSCCTSDGPVTDRTSSEYGKCVGQGIYSGNTKYLCDPPGWNVKEENEVKVTNIFELILSVLLHFFQR